MCTFMPGAKGWSASLTPPTNRRGMLTNDSRPHASGRHRAPGLKSQQGPALQARTRAGQPCRQAAVKDSQKLRRWAVQCPLSGGNADMACCSANVCF